MVRQSIACIVLAISAVAVAADSTLPRQRPLTDRVFEVTAGRMQRGRYLAEHVLQCFICHSERDAAQPGAPPIVARKGAGVVLSRKGDRVIVAPNITPDRETGAGSWTDDMLARSIREGIGHDGRALHPQMWYGSFAYLSDEDLASVVVYLRSIPAVRNALPKMQLPEEERAEISSSPRPITAPVPGPPPGDALARGKYLVTVADCSGCHTSWHSSRNPGLFGGGNLIEWPVGTAWSTNITRDASGLQYPADVFVAVVRTGKGGSLSPVMPWAAFRGMTDEDLSAVHLALGEAQAVRHYVGNHGEAEHCAVCGQSHPFGKLNRLETPAAMPLAREQLDRLVGRYRHSTWDLTVDIRTDGRRLYGVEEGGIEIELIAQSPVRFLAPGWPAPLEFELDAEGRVVRFVTLELDREAFERLP
jgi:mono/diheme cytochrome c family protein